MNHSRLYNQFKDLIDRHPCRDVYDAGYLTGLMAGMIANNDLSATEQKELYDLANDYQLKFFKDILKK